MRPLTKWITKNRQASLVTMERYEVAWQLWKNFLSIPENKRMLAEMSKREEVIFMPLI
jgi:hypothetical protein